MKLTPKKPLPVLYISGPMTGYPEYNFPAFNEMARKLRYLGFPVLNPADFGAGDHTWRECLSRDIHTLTRAEVMFLLPGWIESKGANLEFDVAIGLDIRIVQVPESMPAEPEDTDLMRFLREHFDEQELDAAIREDIIRQGPLKVEFTITEVRPDLARERADRERFVRAIEAEADRLEKDAEERKLQEFARFQAESAGTRKFLTACDLFA